MLGFGGFGFLHHFAVVSLPIRHGLLATGHLFLKIVESLFLVKQTSLYQRQLLPALFDLVLHADAELMQLVFDLDPRFTLERFRLTLGLLDHLGGGLLRRGYLGLSDVFPDEIAGSDAYDSNHQNHNYRQGIHAFTTPLFRVTAAFFMPSAMTTV